MADPVVFLCTIDESGAEGACLVCGDVEHVTADCDAPPARFNRAGTFARERARAAGWRSSSSTPGFRPDGFCRRCDDRHQVGAPCGRPAAPPPGWRDQVREGRARG